VAKKPEKQSKVAKSTAKAAVKPVAKPAVTKKAAPVVTAKAAPVKAAAKPVAKPAPKAAPKAAQAKKPAAKPVAEKKIVAKPTPAAKKTTEKAAPARGPGRPRKDGSADYAVQARKLRALLDCLASGEEISETNLLSAISEQGIEVHPRTLAREIDRLSIIGFPVVRIQAPEGISYQLPEDEVIAEAVASLEAVRKALKKEGSAQEKAVSSVLKLLKD
jgi:hypothetical protein